LDSEGHTVHQTPSPVFPAGPLWAVSFHFNQGWEKVIRFVIHIPRKKKSTLLWYNFPTSQKPSTKKRAGGVAQGVGPEFKPQHCKKKRKKRKSACLSLKNKRERKKSSLP
jgi:hypothetical protein